MSSVLGTITSQSQNNSMTSEFDFCWTIDDFPAAVSNTGRQQSPVFEAISKHWSVELQNSHGHFPSLRFTLDLVDKNGKKIGKIGAEAEKDPLWLSRKLKVNLLFLKEKLDDYSGCHILTDKGPLKDIVNKNGALGSVYFNLEDFLDEGIIQGEKKRVRMLFKFNIVVDIPGNGGQQKNRLLATGGNTAALTFGKRIFDDGKFSDFTIQTGDGHEIRVHRAILHATSNYFEAMLDMGGVEARKKKVQVPESHATMVELVRFLYTGSVSEENVGKESAVEMYIAADKYQIPELKVYFEKAVDALYSVENACSELTKAHTGGIECLKLKASEYIRAHRTEVFGTEGWRELCRDHPDLVAFLFTPALKDE